MAEDTWIMRGLEWDDPLRIRTWQELISWVNEVGFLPLFKNGIPGFSAEEHVHTWSWWTGDPQQDPWEWREIIARSHQVAYGKFFDKKAGFISLAWLPHFANYRRDGYDFDARWEDGLASRREKAIMDQVTSKDRDGDTVFPDIRMESVNWAGFYLVRDGRLKVGPFQGKPACVLIDRGRGVCGTAWEADETIVVRDVHDFSGHIACDSASRSEIVIPIHCKDAVAAVLDIDSPEKGRFSEEDRKGLEQFVFVLEETMKW